jgi:tetratricopeptide (TPR) repeat protein
MALGLTIGGCGARAARRAKAIDSAIYTYANHGAYQEQQGAYADAAESYATAMDIRGGEDDLASSQPRRRAQNSLAWLLATCPEDTVRDGPRAVELAEQIVAAVPRDAVYLNTLAAAYAETHRFEDATDRQEEAIGNLPPGHHLYGPYLERLRAYQDARPWRQSPATPARPATSPETPRSANPPPGE